MYIRNDHNTHTHTHNGHSALVAHQNSIWFTLYANWNTQRNSIWRFIGLNAKFTCPPSSMRRLYTLLLLLLQQLVSVPSSHSVLHPSTDCPLLAICRFATISTMIVDHPIRSIWESDVPNTRELNENKNADAFRTYFQWIFMAGQCNCYCLLVTILNVHV